MGKHVDSLLPAGKSWELVWHDEFDGEVLDRTKWDFRLHLLQQRHETFTDEGAVLDGQGHLRLTLLKKGDHYYSPHLQTGSNYLDRPGKGFCFEKGKFNWPIAKFAQPKFMHQFGYYECRCQLPTQPGWWAAFWLQSPCIGSTPKAEEAGVEVDVMENFTRDGIISHNNHWGGYSEDHQSCGSGPRQLQPTPDDFHVFGLEWNQDEYVYYVDGRESWRVTKPFPISQREQFILISTECMGYRKGDQPSPLLDKALLPDYFVVDYVRVFDRVE